MPRLNLKILIRLTFVKSVRSLAGQVFSMIYKSPSTGRLYRSHDYSQNVNSEGSKSIHVNLWDTKQTKEKE